MRSDDVGLFWADLYQVKAGKTQMVRPTPPIPQTGWRPPETFPDLSRAGAIALDVETYDPDLKEKGPGFRRGAYVVGVSVGTDDGFRGYYPVRHKMGGNMDPEKVFTWLHDQLCESNIPKVGANLLYDLDALANEGVDTGYGPNYDVQVAEPLLDEYSMTYNLDALAEKWLGEGKVDEALYRWSADAFGGKPTRNDQAKHIWQCPVELVGPYAEGDVDLPLRLFAKQKRELEAQNLWNMFDLETRLIPLLLAMRRRGVRVDFDKAEQVKIHLSEQIEEMTNSLGGIDVYSPNDVARFCDQHGITYPRTAKTDQPSFVKEWLKNHADPRIRAISEIRTFIKYRDTFIDSYIHGNHVNGRIHTSFNQLRSDDYGTVSGRFSSSFPNLQNIPKRGKGKIMRAMWVPDEGEEWTRFDWSQIEFRLLVHNAVGRGVDEAIRRYCDDPTTDFHMFVESLTHVGRDDAKNINFGLIYGMGLDKLARSLGKERSEAEPIIETYHSKVPFVRETFQLAEKTAKRRGYIKTLLGRVARFPGMENTHKALNRALQGGAADIMKKAMVDIWESGICNVVGAPLLTVHDELDWSTPKTPESDEAMRECQHIMENCVTLKIPLIAEREVGTNWADCAPLQKAA